ncbi:MAG: DinB family protein [Acidobacteriota bacterium]
MTQRETAQPTTEVPGRLRKLHGAVDAQLAELATLTADATLFSSRSDKVSGWSIGQQIEHLVVVNETVLAKVEEVLAAEGDQKVGGLKPIGFVALTLGRFVRGVARAPRATRPRDVDRTEMVERLGAQQEVWRAIGERLPAIAASKNRFPHPYFGGLTPAQWIRFIGVHNRHHMRIIADIRKKAS